MIDISKYPYFDCNALIDNLMKLLTNKECIEFVDFRRIFNDRKRFHICYNHDWATNFYSKGLYQYCPYEKEPYELTSSYDIWDSLPFKTSGHYIKSFLAFDLAHGLTIIRQHPHYSDSFIFASNPSNFLINNFYLYQKTSFLNFINAFYNDMNAILSKLSAHTFSVPNHISITQNALTNLSERQYNCIRLLATGASAKEIARALELSPRTVESHLNNLKAKFQAKNRTHLIGILGTIL